MHIQSNETCIITIYFTMKNTKLHTISVFNKKTKKKTEYGPFFSMSELEQFAYEYKFILEDI